MLLLLRVQIVKSSGHQNRDLEFYSSLFCQVVATTDESDTKEGKLQATFSEFVSIFLEEVPESDL